MFCFVYWEENLFGIYGLHYWINYIKVKQCSMFCFVWMKEKVSSYIWLEFFEWNILEYIWVYELWCVDIEYIDVIEYMSWIS